MRNGLTKPFENAIRLLLPTAFLLFAASCATIVPPSGGPKDVKPPTMTGSQPKILSTQFKGNKIILEFDEYVKLNNLEKFLLVSPPLGKQPDIKIKGHSVVIKLKDTLRSNTTYNIYLGDAIVDITETNPAANFSFAFSTGSTIDSLSLKGMVTDAFTRLPAKDALVMLYDDFGDSIPMKQIPLYVSRTGANGSFRLNSLAAGRFRIIALKDGNSDYMYNLPSEMIGFGNDTAVPYFDTKPLSDTSAIQLTKVGDSSSISIDLFSEPDSIQRVAKCNMVTANRLTLIFRYPAKNPNVHPLNIDDSIAWSIREWNPTFDTLNAWLLAKPDTLKLEISENGQVLDTLEISTTPKTTGKLKQTDGGNNLKFSTSLASAKLGFGNPLMITFTNPVKFSDTTLPRLYRKTMQDTLLPETVFTDSIRRHLLVKHAWNMDEDYQLYFPKGSFTDIYDNLSDSAVLGFKIKPREEYGTFAVKITRTTIGFPIIVQLTNEKGTVIAQRIYNNEKLVDFGLVAPGKYGLKAIMDKNSNGRWDTGVFLKRQQPETILVHPKLFEVPANWELEEDWSL